MKSKLQYEFRHTFGRNFNFEYENGAFLYQKSIGNASSRPFGTIFEETSYAYQHKNVLFIMADDLRPNLGCYENAHDGFISPTMYPENITELYLCINIIVNHLIPNFDPQVFKIGQNLRLSK